MTVKELIEKLKGLPEDAEIDIAHPYCEGEGAPEDSSLKEIDYCVNERNNLKFVTLS